MFDILKFLEDAPLKLVSGEGNPETGGCWMSALSMYSGASWSDHPACVCETIRPLCIALNDMITSDADRGRIIGPHLLTPVGTATQDSAVIEARKWIAVDAAIRVFAVHALRSSNLDEVAAKLETLPPVTASSAARAAEAARVAEAAAWAAWAARVAEAAAWVAEAAEAAEAAAWAAAWAARAAAWAKSEVAEAAEAAAWAARAARVAEAAVAAKRNDFAETVVLPVILAMCAVGQTAPHEPSCDELSFRKAVQC